MRNVCQAKLMVVLMLLGATCRTVHAAKENEQMKAKSEKLLAELKTCKYKIICETYRDNNWELMIMNADGSNPVNITESPFVDELYPHASRDGTKVVFLAEEGEGEKRTRNVYYMNLDGTERTKVGENSRQPFWSPDGKVIAYLRGTRVNYGEGGNANKELYFYNIEAKKTAQHPKKDMAGLLNPCWSPDGSWIITSVMGGMEFAHSICAIEANGTGVVELRCSRTEAKDIYQCRPDISSDGRHIAWGKEDCHDYMWVEIGDIDLTQAEPKVTNRSYAVTVPYPLQIYHVDWSGDGKYIAYTQGGRGTKMEPAGYVVGNEAKGWDIWVVKPSDPEVVVQITHDGLSYKEPDWIFVK
ncbi:hypothetical protein ACFL1G_12485 [Planctomycetota bacterium]